MTEPPKAEAPAVPVEPSKDQKASEGGEPAKPNAAKSVADQAAESSSTDKTDSPKLDIIQEESHGPGQAAPPKVSTTTPRKKRATSSER